MNMLVWYIIVFDMYLLCTQAQYHYWTFRHSEVVQNEYVQFELSIVTESRDDKLVWWCSDYFWNKVSYRDFAFPNGRHLPLSPKTEADKHNLDVILSDGKCLDKSKSIFIHVHWPFTSKHWMEGSNRENSGGGDCQAHKPTHCVDVRLPPGVYFKHYPSTWFTFFDQRYIVTLPPNEPCAPGTWLTCKDSSTCTYDIPLDYADWQKYAKPLSGDLVTGTISFASDKDGFIPPMGSCFPCANSRRTAHYVMTGAPYCELDNNITTGIVCQKQAVATPTSSDPKAPTFTLVDKCFLKVCQTAIGFQNDNVICQGGAIPPFPCASAFQTDSTRTQCVCLPGKYKLTYNFCEVCPAGHKCRDNQKIQCEDGTYQPQMNQPSCIPCTDNHVCNGNLQPVKCLQSNGLEFQVARGCVPCSQCKNQVIDEQEVDLKLNTSLISIYKDCYPPGKF